MRETHNDLLRPYGGGGGHAESMTYKLHTQDLGEESVTLKVWPTNYTRRTWGRRMSLRYTNSIFKLEFEGKYFDLKKSSRTHHRVMGNSSSLLRCSKRSILRNCPTPRWCGSRRVLSGAPMEIRTPVLALKGPRPGPLDDGGLFIGQSGRILPSPPAPVKQLSEPVSPKPALRVSPGSVACCHVFPGEGAASVSCRSPCLSPGLEW
jgi:hypothetical protein